MTECQIVMRDGLCVMSYPSPATAFDIGILDLIWHLGFDIWISWALNLESAVCRYSFYFPLGTFMSQLNNIGRTGILACHHYRQTGMSDLPSYVAIN